MLHVLFSYAPSCYSSVRSLCHRCHICVASLLCGAVYDLADGSSEGSADCNNYSGVDVRHLPRAPVSALTLRRWIQIPGNICRRCLTPPFSSSCQVGLRVWLCPSIFPPCSPLEFKIGTLVNFTIIYIRAFDYFVLKIWNKNGTSQSFFKQWENRNHPIICSHGIRSITSLLCSSVKNGKLYFQPRLVTSSCESFFIVQVHTDIFLLWTHSLDVITKP